MKKLLISTTSKKKIQTIKNILKGSDIEIISPKDLGLVLDVEENGTTVEENAIIKAKALSVQAKMPVLGWDKSMYVENFPASEQPGLFVRRPKGLAEGQELTDEEMVIYYSEKLKKFGGESKAYYESGVAIVDGERIFSTTFKEDPFILTSEVKESGTPKFNPFDQMRRDIKLRKYYCDMTDEETLNKDIALNNNIKKFVCESLHINMESEK